MATKAERHNAAIRPLMLLLIEHESEESSQWVILESLCLAVGLLHGRSERGTAVFIENMAERLATGERKGITLC